MTSEAWRESVTGTGARRLLLLIWVVSLAVVIVGSLIPGAVLTKIDPLETYLNDKGEHFLAYLALAFLPPLTFANRLFAWAVSVGMLAVGIGLEFAQRLTPDRQFDYADMRADGFGVAAGMVLSWLISMIAAGRIVRRTQ